MTVQHPTRKAPMLTLGQLTERTGVVADDHLDLAEPVPVLDGIQAQGDVIALPLDPTVNIASVSGHARWREVPAGGVTLVQGAHPHVLVADAGTCRYTTDVTDSTGLAVAVVTADAPVWLLHPEHGGTGLAAGSWAIRRQREQAQEERITKLTADQEARFDEWADRWIEVGLRTGPADRVRFDGIAREEGVDR